MDRVARLYTRGTRLGREAFYHVNGSCRPIPANRGEINRQNLAARGEFQIHLSMRSPSPHSPSGSAARTLFRVRLQYTASYAGYSRRHVFAVYHLTVLSAEQNDSQSEEINLIDESPAENRPVPVQEAEIRWEKVSLVGRYVCCA